MDIYTYSEAKQNLSNILDKAVRKGKVFIKGKDGKLFMIREVTSGQSPLEVRGIKINVSRSDILEAIKESRKR
ncbi:MAG: type II toxin-antitoxin system Phd/YefM family antitoxin [Ignavibacterium sp.]|jgi:hypothetical protein|uniref:type II toxin-antitoxin system Phd/YefM family antitoxin n=1 Tax=Ignavibacterium sp. TaxID=2651167 RepID=UPI00329796E2